MEVVQWELIGVIFTLISGFGTLIYIIAKRNTELTHLQQGLGTVVKNQSDHNKGCIEQWKEQNEVNTAIKERLAEGSAKFVSIEKGQDRIEDSLKDLKTMLSK